jgi:hypothetical protein
MWAWGPCGTNESLEINTEVSLEWAFVLPRLSIHTGWPILQKGYSKELRPLLGSARFQSYSIMLAWARPRPLFNKRANRGEPLPINSSLEPKLIISKIFGSSGVSFVEISKHTDQTLNLLAFINISKGSVRNQARRSATVEPSNYQNAAQVQWTMKHVSNGQFSHACGSTSIPIWRKLSYSWQGPSDKGAGV